MGSVVCRLGRPALSESNAHKKYSLDRLKPMQIPVLGKGDCHLCLLARQSFLTTTVVLRIKLSYASSVCLLTGLGGFILDGKLGRQSCTWQGQLRSSSSLLRSISLSQCWAHCKFLPVVTNQMVLNGIKCQFCLLLFHTHLQRKCEPRKHSRRVMTVMNCSELALNYSTVQQFLHDP